LSQEGGPEVFWSELPVQAQLSAGSERLTLFFTSRRILVAHGVKWGSGSIAASSFLGGLGGLVKGVRRRKKPQVEPEQEGFKAGRILAADKDNFSIAYREIVSVVVTEPDDPTGLTAVLLLTGREKLELSSQLGAGRVAEAFRKGLGERVRIQKSRKLPHL